MYDIMYIFSILQMYVLLHLLSQICQKKYLQVFSLCGFNFMLQMHHNVVDGRLFVISDDTDGQ